MALPQTAADLTSWSTGDIIHSLFKSGTDLFAGTTAPFGYTTGAACLTNKSDGSLVSTDPADFWGANNEVSAVISDGSGGWYVGGKFTRILGSARTYLAHINADGTLDTWNPVLSTGGYVNCLAFASNTLYAGGSFSSVGGSSRSGVAAFNAASSHALTTFAPTVSGTVYCITPDASGVFIGGQITLVNSATRIGAALVTGAAGTTNAAWNPNFYNTPALVSIHTIAVGTSAVYVGGFFTKVGGSGGTARTALAAVDKTTGVVTDWNPGVEINPGSSVRAIVLTDTTAVIGGTFASIGGEDRRSLAEINLSDAVATTFDPSPYGGSLVTSTLINSLVVDNGVVYYAGLFTNVGGSTGPTVWNAASAALATSAQGTWNPVFAQQVKSLAMSGTTIAAGGQFYAAAGYNTGRLAKLNATDASAQDWTTPTINGPINAIYATSDTIYIGGTFTTVGESTRNRIAALDRVTGDLLDWYPTGGVNGDVTTIKRAGDYLFVAGAFTTIGGVTTRLAKISIADGTVQAWASGINREVSDLVIDGDYVYCVTFGGPQLPAPFHIETAAAMDGFTAAEFGDMAKCVAVAGDTVYVGGEFRVVYGSDLSDIPRKHIAAFDKLTGELLAWTPENLYNGVSVNCLAADNTYLYMGASVFTYDPDWPAAAAYDLATGTEAWRATISNVESFDDAVHVHALALGSLYLGGQFKTVDEEIRPGLAAYTAVYDGPTDEEPTEEEPTEEPSGDELTVDLALATYRVSLVDISQTLVLTDAIGVSRIYRHNDVFSADEYFDRYTTGDYPPLTKLTNSIEDGEFVDVTVPQATTVLVKVYGKPWSLVNDSEGLITITTGDVSFRVGSGETLPFPLRTDFRITHAQAEDITVSVYLQ